MSTIDLKKARDFVYSSGVPWERALFAWLFESGSPEYVQRCLLIHKNADNGYGHALEHDIRCPDSHPAALEFLLMVLVTFGLPRGTLLDGCAAWVEQDMQPDGFLRNPLALLDYPHAPWWNGGGQNLPDSIVGNLMALNACTPSLAERAKQWVLANVTPETIRANEWLFMTYHAQDYFMNVSDFPNVAAYRMATLDNIMACAEKAPDKQYNEFFRFAPFPDSPVAKAAPHLVSKCLDALENTQQEAGCWYDEHGLPQWYPMVTMRVLLTLRRYGRL